MVYVLGLCCVAWTIVELVRLSEPRAAFQPSRPTSAPKRPGHAPRRAPLAAWDEHGRPVFVEDVSIRGAR